MSQLAQSQSLETKQVYRDISKLASKLANERMRKELIDAKEDTRFWKGIEALGAANLSIMRRSWSPFTIDWRGTKLSVRLNDLDGLFLSKIENRALINEIVTDSIQRAILLNSKDFITNLLSTFLLNDTPDTFTIQYTEDFAQITEEAFTGYGGTPVFRGPGGRFISHRDIGIS